MKQLLLIIGTTKRLRFVVIVSISCMASFIFFYCNYYYYYYYSSGSYYNLLHTYFFNFSSSSVVNRNLMFLICNAILAFLAKTMRLVATVSDDNDYSMEVLKVVESSMAKHLESSDIDDLKQPSFLVPLTLEKTSIMDYSQSVLEKCSLGGDEDGEEVVEELQVEEEELTGKSSLMPNLETDDDHSNKEDESHVEDDVSREEDDDVEEDNMMSTEELNRRIEEFIRKMKEDIRIQHHQSQLIAAR